VLIRREPDGSDPVQGGERLPLLSASALAGLAAEAALPSITLAMSPEQKGYNVTYLYI
jgi:hypothetical protein